MAVATNAMDIETRRSPWWLGLIGGILNIIIGFLLLTSPVRTVLVLVLVLGYYWVFTGIYHLVYLFIDRSAWGWKLLMGLLSIVAGVYILRYPLIGAVTIPTVIILFLGIQGVVGGAIALLMAFKGGGWGEAIVGVLGMIFGVILLANFTNLAAIVTLIWVAGIMAVAGGIGQIVFAFRYRNE